MGITKTIMIRFAAILLLCGLFFVSIFAPLLQARAADWQQLGQGSISGISTFAHSLAVDESSGQPWLAFSDPISHKLIAKRFNGSNWVNVGSSGIVADGDVQALAIAFDGSGAPYVAYRDSAAEQKVSVKKYQGGSWTYVGMQGFTAGEVGSANVEIAFDGNTPYVAFTEILTHGVGVMKYDGSKWVAVGDIGFTSGAANLSLAIDPVSRRPWVMHSFLWSSPRVLNVVAFDGSRWISKGEADFASGEITGRSLTFNSSGKAYVAYSEETSEKINVRTLSDGSWKTVGAVDFSGQAARPSVAVDKNGSPAVSFQDFGKAGKGTVMKFEGGSWSAIGTAGFTSDTTFNPVLATDNKTGDVYFGYDDGFSGLSVFKFSAPQTASPVPPAQIPVTPAAGPTAQTASVYRFWSQAKQHHFYTMDSGEKDFIIANDKTWTYEGVRFGAFPSQVQDSHPIYRFWSDQKQGHFFTADSGEKDHIIANDKSWKYEGISYYAHTSPRDGATAVYRFWSDQKQGHFYTTDSGEKDHIIANDPSWKYEGIAYYVPSRW